MDILRCFLLHTYDKILLVPCTTIAEIIPNASASLDILKSSPNQPKVAWRGLNIPYVSLENLQGIVLKETEATKGKHIAILHTLMSNNTNINFFAMQLKKIPTLLRIKKSDIQSLKKADNPWLMQVVSREKTLFIPNLEWIERQVFKRP